MPDFALQEMELEDAHVWFVRFAMDRQCRTLACGTRSGHVFVWDPADLKSKPHAKLKRDAGSKTTVSAPVLNAARSTLSCRSGAFPVHKLRVCLGPWHVRHE